MTDSSLRVRTQIGSGSPQMGGVRSPLHGLLSPQHGRSAGSSSGGILAGISARRQSRVGLLDKTCCPEIASGFPFKGSVASGPAFKCQSDYETRTQGTAAWGAVGHSQRLVQKSISLPSSPMFKTSSEIRGGKIPLLVSHLQSWLSEIIQ